LSVENAPFAPTNIGEGNPHFSPPVRGKNNCCNGFSLTEVLKKEGILLANSEVPKYVEPTCLLGRQKSWENFPKKKYLFRRCR
jgi:hypothetical protein